MSWAHYLLQVNIYLVIFYCFYKLLLDKETYFVLNRIYLIASGVLSLAIPFLRFEWFSKQEVAKGIYTSVGQLNDLVTQVTVLEDQTEKFNWGNFIVLVYLLGILFCIGRFILQLVAIKKLLKTIGNGMAFSFLNKKIISANVPEAATVNLHEDIHVKQLHTLDVLFFEFLGILTWFNPIIYAYKKTIKNIHEYLADEAAAKFQGDKEAYAMLLLSQAFGVRPNSLTNGFFTKSLIKKRIYMLHKQRSKKVAILKYGLFVPLFALTLVLSSATIRKNEKILAVAEKISLDQAKNLVQQVFNAPSSVVNLIVPPPPVAGAVSSQVLLVSDADDNSDIDSKSAFNDLYHHLFSNIVYANAAAANKVQGNTIVNFTVKHGRIIDAFIQNELGYGLDEEVKEAILTYTNNIVRDGKYSMKVSFKLDNADSPFKNANIESIDSYTELPTLVINGYSPKEKLILDKASMDAYNSLPTISVSNIKEPSLEEVVVHNYVPVAVPPMYPGGNEKFNNFLSKTIKYPVAAADNDIQGTVNVNFIVEKDGSLSNLKTDRKLGFGLEEEAMRVLKLSKWLPAVQNGKAVRVAYSMPIKFTLDQDKNEKANVVASIRLRNFPDGPNAPILIVDGELKETNTLKELDPKKIESLSVLKDATAIELYGKKALNGAIVITSKKAEKPKVSATIFK